MERFEDYARHQRTADVRTRVLHELDVRFGGPTPHPRLDALAARLRERRTTLLPVPEVACVALFAKDAPLGVVYDGPVVGIHGLLVDTASNPQLAFVLAHELAHVALGHIDEKRRRHPGLSVLRRVAGSFKRPLDRRELDADRLAYRWLSDAGLQTGAWEFFHWIRRRYESAGLRSAVVGLKTSSPTFNWLYRHLRSHPSIEERLGQLRLLDPHGEGRAVDELRQRKRGSSRKAKRTTRTKPRSTKRRRRAKRKRKR